MILFGSSSGALIVLPASSASSVGTSDLQFGSEFLWDTTNEELKLGWAEVAIDGSITYAF